MSSLKKVLLQQVDGPSLVLERLLEGAVAPPCSRTRRTPSPVRSRVEGSVGAERPHWVEGLYRLERS